MIEEIQENITDYFNEKDLLIEKLQNNINDYISFNKFEQIKSILCPNNDKYKFDFYTNVYGDLEIIFCLRINNLPEDNRIEITINMGHVIDNNDIEIIIDTNIDEDIACWNKDNYDEILKILNLEEIDYEIL